MRLTYIRVKSLGEVGAIQEGLLLQGRKARYGTTKMEDVLVLIASTVDYCGKQRIMIT